VYADQPAEVAVAITTGGEELVQPSAGTALPSLRVSVAMRGGRVIA
jgi:hypothetical protein